MSSGYALHPEAFTDLDDIRDYIAQQNPDAADRVVSEILTPFAPWCLSRVRATDALISLRALCGLLWSVDT